MRISDRYKFKYRTVNDKPVEYLVKDKFANFPISPARSQTVP